MKSRIIVKTSFIISFILILGGIYLQIIHSEGAIACLTAGLIALIVFIVATIFEIRASKNLNHSEKITWTFGITLFSLISGLAYILISRKRITANHEQKYTFQRANLFGLNFLCNVWVITYPIFTY